MFNTIYLNVVQERNIAMDKNANVKNRIIEVTTELIEKHNGNIKDITARMIATKADVGLGLINYHFGSKEKLITECVQRIIEKVVTEFQMTNQYETDKERLILFWVIYKIIRKTVILYLHNGAFRCL